MNSKKYLSIIAILGTVTSLAVALPALAALNGEGNQPNPSFQGQMRSGGKASPFGKGQIRPGVFGTVASVSGNTLTVTSTGRPGFRASTTPTTAVTTTYTVDATNAVVTKNNATSSVSAIAVGDIVIVQGTITGSNVVATKINDGVAMGRKTPGQVNPNGDQNPAGIVGNGEPVVAGTISTISGSIITITNKSNTTYTIDATNAKISNGNTSSSISNLVVGDSVLVQGTVNGNSITATTVLDQTNPNTSSTNDQKPKGFFGGIGQFFMHLFGF